MINLEMNRYDMKISVKCEEPDYMEVNTAGFLTKLEEFLRTLEEFDKVSVSIETKKEEWSDNPGLETVSVSVYDQYPGVQDTMNSSFYASPDIISVREPK